MRYDFSADVNALQNGTGSYARRSRAKHHALLILLACALWMLATLARGMPGHVPLERLHHAVWTPKEGAPSDVWAISQTPDGWMWFGGPGGVYRFDGVKFERIETEPAASTRSRAVSALMALPSGELVVGYHNGGLSIIKNGLATSYHEQDGFDGATVFDLTYDSRGSIWAATRTGLHRMIQGRWQLVGTESGVPPGATFAVARDLDGRVWVSTATQILSRGADDSSFTGALAISTPAAFVAAPDGRLWCADIEQIFVCPLQHRARSDAVIPRSTVSNTSFFARDGTLWIFAEHGLARTVVPEGKEHLHGLDKPGPSFEVVVDFKDVAPKTMLARMFHQSCTG